MGPVIWITGRDRMAITSWVKGRFNGSVIGDSRRLLKAIGQALFHCHRYEASEQALFH